MKEFFFVFNWQYNLWDIFFIKQGIVMGNLNRGAVTGDLSFCNNFEFMLHLTCRIWDRHRQIFSKYQTFFSTDKNVLAMNCRVSTKAADVDVCVWRFLMKKKMFVYEIKQNNNLVGQTDEF